MSSKIIVLGGGIGGMSAAHELVERGFDVEVYERQPEYVGGKARSVNVPGTNLQHDDKYLPGEHGFRFFPGFYKHVTDTMKRIPFWEKDGTKNELGCFDNLVSTTRILLARENKEAIKLLANFPKTKKDVKLLLHDAFGGIHTGLTREEELFFAERIWQCMTSSKERKFKEYEKISWWDFMEADRFSEVYRNLLVRGLTRSLVAARAEVASMKTGSSITLQLMYNMFDPLVSTDRVLNGPTNDVWLDPWYTYLTEERGVKYFKNHNVEALTYENGQISCAKIRNDQGEIIDVEGDYYILATPVERAINIISDNMIKADSSLGKLKKLAKSTAWMNGIQYYLNEDVSMSNGHVCYIDSKWAITSISQVQFWKDYDLSDRYNGKVKGVLSVDISDWVFTEYEGLLAENCEPHIVKDLVWKQIKESINVDGKEILRDDMIEHWYLDRDIQWSQKLGKSFEEEPLLINSINSWELRPEAETEISNFFLASDYVKTNTDLATMEGANEAARRAVNGILKATNSTKAPCKIWDLHEPDLFIPLKWWDKRRYNKGLPWTDHYPIWLDLIMLIWVPLFLLKDIIKIFIYKITGRHNG